MRFTKLIPLFAATVMATTVTAFGQTPAPAIEKSQVIVFINGQKFYIHNVKAGDTIYSIAKAYGVD